MLFTIPEPDAIANEEKEMSDVKNKMRELKEGVHGLGQSVQAYDASIFTEIVSVHGLEGARSAGESRRSGPKRHLA